MSTFLTLLRQRLRRDLVQLPLWIIGTAALAVLSASAVESTYGDLDAREDVLRLAVASRTILVFRGTPQGAELGPFTFFGIFAFLGLLAGLMSTFLAVRHSRGDEEAGRAELIAATPAARIMPTVATFVHGTLANVVLGVLVALGFLAAGLPGGGSFVTGAAVAAVGVVFLAFGLLAAQFFRTSRGANGASIAFVAGAYLVRGVGDAAGTPSADLLHLTPAWPSWLSPIGWGQLTGAWARDDLRPLLLALGLAAVFAAAVFGLQSVRDQGASLLPGRAGRASAGPVLASSLGLAWRLAVPSIIAWGVGAFLFGALATSLTALVDQIGTDAPEVAQVLQDTLGGGASLEQTLVTTFFTLIGILAACCGVQTAMRARQEEVHGTAEITLAAPVPRKRWLAEYLLVGTVAIGLVLAVAALGGVLGAQRGTDPAGLRSAVWQAALAQAPAALVFLAATLLVFTLLPRITIGLGWTLVGALAFVGMFGPIVGAPNWVLDLSPFSHSPAQVGTGIDWTDGFWMLAIAAVLAALSVASMGRRELAAGG